LLILRSNRILRTDRLLLSCARSSSTILGHKRPFSPAPAPTSPSPAGHLPIRPLPFAPFHPWRRTHRAAAFSTSRVASRRLPFECSSDTSFSTAVSRRHGRLATSPAPWRHGAPLLSCHARPSGFPEFQSLEGTIGSDYQGAAFIAAVDDFVEQVGGVGVIGQVADLVQAKQGGTGIEVELLAQALRGIVVEVGQQARSGAEQHGVSRPAKRCEPDF